MISSRIRGKAAPSSKRLKTIILLAAALGAASGDARAEGFHLFPAPPSPSGAFASLDSGGESAPAIVAFESSYPWSSRGGADLGYPAESLAGSSDSQETPAPEASPAPPKKLFTKGTIIVSVATVLASAAQGLGAPLQYGWVDFHTTNEGFFSRDTYAGGADKASHFVISSGAARALYDVYTRYQGHSPDESFTLALATTFMGGLAVELLDGASVYGFSFQDLTADALGSTAGALIQRNHLQDLLGLRLGMADTDIPAWAVGSSEPTLGRSYSDEIYLADLKLGGLITRMHGNPGIARFFLTSFTFFTKGFGYAPPLPSRYQEIGFELGLNIPEILKAVGVKESTWWGASLLAIFNFFRVPFTQVGVYYNLFNHKWYGPGAPYHYY